jgi:hypothetical protein
MDAENERRDGKLVWELAEHLRINPDRVSQTQSLTLDKGRPLMGLRGAAGLYGSADWWAGVASGRIPTVNRVGTITKLVFAGQDARWGNEVNSFEMTLDDGTVVLESIRASSKGDRCLFKVGATVSAKYALDELKKQPGPDGGVNRLAMLLEMKVSSASSTASPL